MNVVKTDAGRFSPDAKNSTCDVFDSISFQKCLGSLREDLPPGRAYCTTIVAVIMG